jgi:uncharacterized protein (TIGR04141 family)
MEGRWFEVTDSLSRAVSNYWHSLGQSGVQLPSSAKTEQEAEYNRRVAANPSHRFVNLDARIARPGGASSGIELCDLLTADGEFLHIKRKSRSSTLSHLFSQGAVSAQAFIGDGVFRDRIREAIAKQVPEVQQTNWLSLVPPSTDGVDKSRYTVSYAVIAPARDEDSWLPFFSQLNLMQHGKTLTNLDLKVTITRIPLEDPASSSEAVA